MAPRESIFLSLSPSLADMVDAVEKIETIIAAKTLKKQLLYDMLLGFQLLEQSLQNKQSEAYKLVIIWLNLFLKIQSFISSPNEAILDQFEKIVPSAVTYMIGYLQHKAKGITSYHFQLLEMIHELLSNVRPAVLEKLATFQTDVIACIWFPIDFVGDFNTQLMALRLLVMLLKCLDSTRLQNELDNIRCTDRTVIKDKLTAAIAVANFHAAKFENTARDLLNTYNMHLSKNILVYSFRCKTFKFGDSIEFFKPMNAANFWIDINYCPSTLTFSGRCQTNNQIGYATCSVILQIVKLSLNNHRLYVQFQAPAQLINASSDFPDLTNITMTEIVLDRDEAMRLQENKFILKYYNKSHRPINTSVVKLHTTSIPIQFQSIEDVEKTVLNTNANLINDNLVTKNNDTDKNTVNMENKENVPPEEGHTTTTTQCTKSTASNMETASKLFKKSYDFLIGLSKKDNEEVHSDEENTIAETKRSRKTLPRAVKKDVPKELLLAANSQVLKKAKPIRKRALCMDSFDELKGETVLQKKIGKSEKIASNNKNQTICSTDMENIADAVLHSCSSYKRHQSVENLHARTFAIQKPSHILNDSLNLNEVSNTATQTFRDNISSNQVEDIEMRNLSTVSAEVAELGGDQVDEIQECRRDVAPNVHDCEEFSDCPTILHLTDISDMLPSSECSIVYYSRSENDSNSDSDCEKSLVSQTNTLGSIAQPLELPQVFVTPQTMPLNNFLKTTSVTECHVTTTATSIITHQDHVIHHQEFVDNLEKVSNTPLNLSKSCSRATTTTTTNTVVKEKTQINLNSFIRRPMNITTPTPRALKQEVSNMISTHRANLNLQLEHMETDVNKNSAHVYIKKICDVGERIMTEIARERKSLMELEVNAERLARQLSWQYEAYQQKTQQFECFKQNIDHLLCVLSNVNLLEEMESDAQNKIQQLQQTSNSMAAQEWRSFINETTENLLKDLSSLTYL